MLRQRCLRKRQPPTHARSPARSARVAAIGDAHCFHHLCAHQLALFCARVWFCVGVGQGKVTTSELGLVLRSMNKNFSEDQLKKIVGRFDVNGDGQIDFDEFFAMMTRYERKEVDELRAAFNVFDRDGDGTISAKELEMIMKALGENIDRETIDLMIESVDTDKNGFIDFNEFKQMMKDGPPPADENKRNTPRNTHDERSVASQRKHRF